MKTTLEQRTSHELTPGLHAAITRACDRIAPTWPLDRFIAVNPLWGFTERPLPEAAAQVGALCGGRLVMPRAWYRELWLTGQLRRDHLREAIEHTKASRTPDELIALLDSECPVSPRRSLVTDVADSQRDLTTQPAWSDFVRSDISQFCAAFFDDGQARLKLSRDAGLYASYRRYAQQHRSPALLMGLGSYRSVAQALPTTAAGLMASALAELEVPASETENYLASLLLDINGWAAWCAYLRWNARLRGEEDTHLMELLALRLSWEWVLHRAGSSPVRARWPLAVAAWPSIDHACANVHADEWLLQSAVEVAYQAELVRGLTGVPNRRLVHHPFLQAVFCIDVRSEPFRRALEQVRPGIQTLGFAGFFGVPADYRPIGAEVARPQLPGLLAPRVRITESAPTARLASRRSARLRLAKAWKAFQSSAASGFTFVETVGLLYAGRLLQDSFGLGRSTGSRRHAGLSTGEFGTCKPRLAEDVDGNPMSLDARVELAASILRAMSLTRDFARLVLLVGHGSESANNPHAAGLDCGACCGQTGEVNARAVAALLNDGAVRDALRLRGIDIPRSSWFVPAVHNTTTERIELHDLDEVPNTHHEDTAAARRWLSEAERVVRKEHAAKLGIVDPDPGRKLLKRARDWSQTRPEWGLANNASFIVAPREHCRHLNLAGRAFLHEYRWMEDEDCRVLELIMTAPMVVAHWINMQYYASTVDNRRYGSGNKVLHNVVGGHLGVFEGNGGDLRIGLPLQSLHDGEKWMHTPLRLSVFIEAPREGIAAVLAKHSKVRELVENEWIHLFQFDAKRRTVHAYRERGWQSSLAGG